MLGFVLIGAKNSKEGRKKMGWGDYPRLAYLGLETFGLSVEKFITQMRGVEEGLNNYIRKNSNYVGMCVRTDFADTGFDTYEDELTQALEKITALLMETGELADCYGEEIFRHLERQSRLEEIERLEKDLDRVKREMKELEHELEQLFSAREAS